MSLRICVSAGELSGDEHAAGLVHAIRAENPAATVSGMGGSRMRAAGVETVIDSEHAASVMGFGDVAKSIFKILATLSALKAHIASVKPDLLILVDYPDFNLRVASYAASLKIPVFYFIPPTIWAWRAYRVRAIKRSVARVALIYPFEKPHFLRYGYDQAYFVGHPFCDDPEFNKSVEAPASWFSRHGLDAARPLVAILPGSRKGEIQKHLGLCTESAKILRQAHPELQFALGIAPSLSREDFMGKLLGGDLVQVLQGDTLGLLRHASAGMLKSGTSNLQAAFFGLPFVMFYKTSLFAEAVVKTLVGLKQYSPVNIIRKNSVLELTQRAATPENIAGEIERLLYDQAYRSKVKLDLELVRNSLRQNEEHLLFKNTRSAYERAAKLALELCK